MHKFQRLQYWRDTNDAGAQIDETGPPESMQFKFRGQGMNATRVLAACWLERTRT